MNTIVLEIAKTILTVQSIAFHDAKEDVFKDFSSTIFFSKFQVDLFSFVKFLRLNWDCEPMLSSQILLSAEVAWKILSILANEISVRQFLDLSF